MGDDEDKRQYQRLPVAMTVEVMLPAGGKQVLRTRDISEGGVFLECEDELQALGVGTELYLTVTLSLEGDAPPTVKARVVRATDEGIGVRFEKGPDTE